MTVGTLIEEVKKLPPADQAELLDELIRIVEPDLADVSLTPEQKVDLDRRIAEFRSGRAVMIDGDEVRERFRNRR